MAQMKFFRPPAPQKDLHYRCFDSEKAHPHNPTFSGRGCLTRAGESKGGMSFKDIRFRILLRLNAMARRRKESAIFLSRSLTGSLLIIFKAQQLGT